MTHIKPTDYVDEYMLVTESMTYSQRFEKAKELMDRAKSQLVKISSGQKTYSIDTRSFLFNKQFKHFSEQLCAGAIIYVEIKNDTMEQLHLTGIDINFDDKSTNFTLGNKYDRSDLKALYDDALGQNSKSFSELKYIAGIIEDQQKQLDYQRNWVADLRTLTLDNVLTSEDQAIEINNRGLIGRKRRLDENGEWDFDENGNPYFEDEQVKLINNTLVFTEDNWEHAATAVGKIAVGYDAKGNVKYSYGINGQVLIGELILGNNLVLTGTGAGIKIKDKNGNNAFYADDNGNLILSGTIFANSGEIGGWTIDSGCLFYQSDTIGTGLYGNLNRAGIAISAGSNQSNVANAPFRVYHDGSLFATRATIEGTVTANAGIIGGWHIGKDKYHNEDGLYYEYITSDIQRYTLLSINGIKMHWQPDDYNYNVSWAEVCRAAINGSDFRIKNTIEDLNENAETFFNSLLPCSFYYNQQASMGSSSKKHFGFVAQDIIKSMYNADILDFAGIWNSDITSFYNLDKQEFIALNTWQIQKAKARITELENAVAELKTQIQTLTAG